ncbi:exported hypothetical protein [Magnetospirillum sp. LM-5]|uniref:hypothetical protein n=1 Tax=Magnetospirillum sp. LM-5 TaxID=2681466 RepID=UPI00137EFC45|nr:hypothetical protein [Magnetospirillum sp. LM-5]CAA7625042.1 exported hypothetical protein [Magnetospirillum sp. LM-5]
MIRMSKSIRALVAAAFLSTGLSGCAATFNDQGGLADEAADSVFKADSKQMRALRGTVALSVLGNLAIQRHHKSDDEVLAIYAQIMAAARPLGVAYAYARSADCPPPATGGCAIPGRFVASFDQAMIEAVSPLMSLAVTGMPNIDGSKLLSSVGEQNYVGALVQLWNIVVDLSRSGRRLAAGYRDGIDLQAAVLTTDFQPTGTLPADNPHAKLKAAYSPLGADLGALRELIAAIGNDTVLGPQMRRLQPNAKWLLSEFSLLQESCQQHHIDSRVAHSTMATQLKIDASNLCTGPETAFREAHDKLAAKLGLTPLP